MFFGPRTFFDNPQGLATAKMISRDDPSTVNDDDEVVVYGVNAERHQLIYNTSMWTLALYGSRGNGRDQFHGPEGIACDPRGNVYVVDKENNRVVHLFNQKRTVAWVKAFGGDGAVRLSSPSQVALDEQGRVYVTDTGNRRIVVFDSTGAVATVMPDAGGSFSFVDGPAALAVADGTNYWSYFRKERCIFCVDSSGRRVRKLGFGGDVQVSVVLPGSHRAAYAAVDYYHNLWLTDTRGGCILKYDHNLALLDIFGSPGTGDNQFVEPRGIAIWKRFGQTFIAEKSGAQYYWVGTEVKECSLRNGKRPGHVIVSSLCTEYSYLSLFSATGADTLYYFSKRMVYPGKRESVVAVPGSVDDLRGQLILRAEPTYSSYTYSWKDYPVTLNK
jgi:outer membrane protein assembly factor BamB